MTSVHRARVVDLGESDCTAGEPRAVEVRRHSSEIRRRDRRRNSWRRDSLIAVAQNALLTHHGELPIQLIRLEVAFSPARFVNMLHVAERSRGDIASSFVTLDAVFPIAYAASCAPCFCGRRPSAACATD